MEKIDELLQLIQTEPIEETIYRGESRNIVGQRAFGGQVLAQALNAAINTVPEDRFVHSLHGYFILPGDVTRPIVYEVDTIRDGGTFTTRRVVAIQKGRAIFNMSASFQLEEEGFDHQISMINVPPPDSLIDDVELTKIREEKRENRDEERSAENIRRAMRPIEFRRVERYDNSNPIDQQPMQHVWIRARGAMPYETPADKAMHRAVLAYASDYNLLSTSLLPHRSEIKRERMQVASLDHAMWFHRDFRMDEWLLYAEIAVKPHSVIKAGNLHQFALDFAAVG